MGNIRSPPMWMDQLPDGRKGGRSELDFGRPLVGGSVTYVTIVTMNWLHDISYSVQCIDVQSDQK